MVTSDPDHSPQGELDVGGAEVDVEQLLVRWGLAVALAGHEVAHVVDVGLEGHGEHGAEPEAAGDLASDLKAAGRVAVGHRGLALLGYEAALDPAFELE